MKLARNRIWLSLALALAALTALLLFVPGSPLRLGPPSERLTIASFRTLLNQDRVVAASWKDSTLRGSYIAVPGEPKTRPFELQGIRPETSEGITLSNQMAVHQVSVTMESPSVSAVGPETLVMGAVGLAYLEQLVKIFLGLALIALVIQLMIKNGRSKTA